MFRSKPHLLAADEGLDVVGGVGATVEEEEDKEEEEAIVTRTRGVCARPPPTSWMFFALGFGGASL